MKHEGVTPQQLDAACCRGPSIQALISPENPFCSVVFRTLWDDLLPPPGVENNMTKNDDISPGRTTMKPYRFTRGICDVFGETFDVTDRRAAWSRSNSGAGPMPLKPRPNYIVAALNAYHMVEDSQTTTSGPYRYTRSKDGCDEVFDVVNERGEIIVSVHFWEAVEASEAKARLIVGALNAYSEQCPSPDMSRLVIREGHPRSRSSDEGEN